LEIKRKISFLSKFNLHRLVQLNLPIAISGGFLTCIIGITASSELSWCYSLVVCFGILAVYNLHRWYKLKLVSNTSDKHCLLNGLVGLVSLLVSSVLFMLVLKDLITLLLLGVLFFISIWYVYPLFGIKLREIRMFKGILVAVVWTVVVAVFPMFYAPQPAALNFIIGLFLFLLALTIPFDIRDIRKDGPGKITLPQVVGVPVSKIVSIVFLMLGLLLTVSTNLKMSTIGAALFILFLYMILLRYLKSDSSSAYFAFFDLLLVAFAGLIYLVA
jgi:hypothetical protein